MKLSFLVLLIVLIGLVGCVGGESATVVAKHQVPSSQTTGEVQYCTYEVQLSSGQKIPVRYGDFYGDKLHLMFCDGYDVGDSMMVQVKRTPNGGIIRVMRAGSSYGP